MHVITPERPVYGLSDPAPNRKICDFGNDSEELADRWGIDHFHVAEGSGGVLCSCLCNPFPKVHFSATLFSSGGPPEIMRSSKGMQAGNKIAFFLAKYAPFLLKIMLGKYANAVQKNPGKYGGF